MLTGPWLCDCGKGYYRFKPTRHWPNRFVCDGCRSITLREDNRPVETCPECGGSGIAERDPSGAFALECPVCDGRRVIAVRS
jgi:DnaJ-class molecular chaperone